MKNASTSYSADQGTNFEIAVAQRRIDMQRVVSRFLLTAFLTLTSVVSPTTLTADDSPNIKINVDNLDPKILDDEGLIWGWADLHAHQFSNLSFGGRFFVGDVTGEPKTALRDRASEHGIAGLGDLIGNFLRTGNPINGHAFSGYPSYKGWPRWDTYNHQTMYYKWVKRAFLGGQKLMVVLAVNNELLCNLHGPLKAFGCDDMDLLIRQVQGAKELERFIDMDDNGIRDDSGWYKIVYSAAQARRVIEAGRMAVVLGSEVDSFLGCKDNAVASCEQNLETRLNEIYNLGIRHVFPQHVFNNAFGGAAIQSGLYDLGNFVLYGEFLDTRECDQPGEANDFVMESQISFGEALELLLFQERIPDYSAFSSQCNQRGLSSVGSSLIDGLMGRGMIIDVDHMSNTMFNEVLAKAKAGDYPLTAGHTTPLGMMQPGNASEGVRTDAELREIRDLGGMVAINLLSKSRDRLKYYNSANNQVPFNCSKSAQGWAQAYLYAVDQMSKDANGELLSVGVGTDFNGLIATPAPRFGNPDFNIPACGGEAAVGDVGGKVVYPFTPHGFSGSFAQQQNNTRSYDINKDGLAHAGLLPDFIEELKVIGMTDEQLKPLFHSAEKYIQMWEKSEASGTIIANPPPPEILSWDYSSSASLVGGWYDGPASISLKLSVEGDGEVDSNLSIYQRFTSPSTVTPPPYMAVGGGIKTFKKDVTEEGINSVSFYSKFLDRVGRSPLATHNVRIDLNAPTLRIYTPQTEADESGWISYINWIKVNIESDDGNGSGIANIRYTINGESSLEVFGPYATTTIREDGIFIVDATVVDNIGRSTTVQKTIQIDNTGPTIEITLDSVANENHWYNEIPEVIISATDVHSGLASCEQIGELTEGQNQSVSAKCTDNAGNVSYKEIRAINIDITPPQAVRNISSAANENGWHNNAVFVTFSATDELSGLARSCQGSMQLFSETTGTEVAGVCSDRAGNETRFDPVMIKIDLTRPSVTSSQLPAANDFGWNNSPVMIKFSGTDELSGVETCTESLISEEGKNMRFSGSCTDFAGNTLQIESSGINIDLLPPVVSTVAVPQANEAGWHNRDVTVHFVGEDALSGIGSCSPETLLNEEGTGFTVDGFCRDKAGNEASMTSEAFKIDKTRPVMTTSTSPDANRLGWNNEDVTVSFSGEDALSGLASCSEDAVVSEEAKFTNRSGSCTDNAGNTMFGSSRTIRLDKTGPLVFGDISPQANAANWHHTNVGVSFTGSDALSGFQGCSSPITLTTEGKGIQIAGFCKDAADNVTTLPLSINIDKTAPLVATAGLPEANVFGWNNENVTVNFSGTDRLSGIATCSSDIVISEEGESLSSLGGCTDVAGNESTVRSRLINLDKTAPQITSTLSPQANGSGWNNSDVQVSFSAIDVLSLVQSCADSILLTTEGQGIQVSGSCNDYAGNVTTLPLAVNIDKTAPTLTCSVTPDSIWPPNNQMVEVENTVLFSDGLSGTGPIQLTSVESNGIAVNTRSLIDQFDLGTFDTTGRVRAAILPGKKSDRQYSISYTGSDVADNSASCITNVVVPFSRKR